MSYLYLACPYSHPDPGTRLARVLAADAAAAYFMDRGSIVYSPLSHSHRIAEFMHADPCSQKFWLKQCWPFVKNAQEVYILTLRGWTQSTGVRFETESAWALGVPVSLVSPEGYGTRPLERKSWSVADIFQGV